MASKHDTGGKGDSASTSDLYATIRKLPNIEPANIVLKVASPPVQNLSSSHSNRISNNGNQMLDTIPEHFCPERSTTKDTSSRIPEERPKSALPLQDRGDGSIRVHSLSSNFQVLIPETHSNRGVSNAPRPRTAFVVPVQRSNGGSRPGTATSTMSFVSGTSTRPSTINSMHAPVYPNPFTAGSYRSMSMSSRSRSNSTTSSIAVNQMSSQVALKNGATLRKKFQFSEPSSEDEGDYNEWRVGMEDLTQESRDRYELSGMFYCVEQEYPPHDSEDSDCKNKYYLLPGRIAEYNLDFVRLPTPPGFRVQCRITRSKKGIGGTLYPTYYMHLERKGNPEVLLLTAKRSGVLKLQYIISTNPAYLSTKGKFCAGVLESNMRGSEFVLKTPVKTDDMDETIPNHGRDEEDIKHKEWERLFTLKFEPNAMGIKGPRSLSVTIPKLKSDWEHCHPANDRDMDYVVTVKNRAPKWSSDSCTYVLNFSSRVQKSSVKNFQLSYPDKDQDFTLLQFGRGSKDDSFILDFNYPFCPLQAFAIALCNFDCKWGTD